MNDPNDGGGATAGQMPPEVLPWLTIILFLVFIILIALGGLLLLRSRPEPAAIIIHPPLPTATSLPTAAPGPVLVYVTGAVHQPGSLHLLPFGSRVTDAVAAAGGLTDLAVLSLVNMAGSLRDGDQIHAPSIHQVGGGAVLPTPSVGRVDVNTATVAELETLPSIGPVMAQRIVNYRGIVGPFASLDELDHVSGIGPATLAELRGLVAFD